MTITKTFSPDAWNLILEGLEDIRDNAADNLHELEGTNDSSIPMYQGRHDLAVELIKEIP